MIKYKIEVGFSLVVDEIPKDIKEFIANKYKINGITYHVKELRKEKVDNNRWTIGEYDVL